MNLIYIYKPTSLYFTCSLRYVIGSLKNWLIDVHKVPKIEIFFFFGEIWS